MQWHVVVFINSTSYLRDQYLYVALNCCFNIVYLQVNSQQAVLFPHRHPVLVPLCHDVHHHPACTWHAYDMCSEGEKHAEHQSGASAVVAQPCTLMHPQAVILHNHASEAAIKRKEKVILTFCCLRTPTVLRCITLFYQKHGLLAVVCFVMWCKRVRGRTGLWLILKYFGLCMKKPLNEAK